MATNDFMIVDTRLPKPAIRLVGGEWIVYTHEGPCHRVVTGRSQDSVRDAWANHKMTTVQRAWHLANNPNRRT